MYTKAYRNGNWYGFAPADEKSKTARVKKEVLQPVKCKQYGSKPKEPRVEKEKKMQPEKVKEKIKAKEEKLASLRSKVNVLSAFLSTLEDATEEEIKGDLHVECIDFQLPANTKKHRTNMFKCTQRKDEPDLVLRRGSTFQIRLELDREFSKKDHDVKFIMSIGNGITKDTWCSFQLDENQQDGDSKKRKEWYAQLVTIEKKSIVVEISIPPNIIIGHWLMSVQTFTIEKGEEATVLQYNSQQDIVILLNPWCPDDTTYFPTKQLLDEYVLDAKGFVYQGTHNRIHAKPWNFGQFKEGILDICIMILNKAFDWTVETNMANPIKIARAISRIVNNNDDFGVLIGKWNGEYGDGKKPTSWNGSVKILKKFARTGEPVKYGQCWVFSGLVVTVCRALGLPCRSITNFASAHDTDRSITIDTVYRPDPDDKDDYIRDEGNSTDSVWNFHVWNEVWMARDDLPPGNDGWQVIDATPQETSNGMFACGPAPLTAIKRGDCVMNYDTGFIFAEVNADCISWVVEDNIWKKLSVKPHRVGMKISTKDPESSNREDVTHCYKYSEGTKENSEAVRKATSSSDAERNIIEVPYDIDIDITDIDDVLMGTTVEIRIKVKNISDVKEKRTVKSMVIDVHPKSYDGVIENKKLIKREKVVPFSLEAGDEKVLKMVITKEDYMDKLLEQEGMEIKALASVQESAHVVVEKEVFRLRKPDIDIKVSPENVELGQKVKIEMSLKNPLDVPLTCCSYSLDSEICGLDDESIEIEDVPAHGEWNLTLEETVWQYPTFLCEIISGSFECKELPNIDGSSNSITVT
ncbi:protein-glutamine gamma-glutamyltransferase Z-like [Ylistrum balloti]|uniref:protein-glutamine gamma-glutamyltransferase Z-like n=1 Tax=Ylistrum balloti TaxID=509963 RepID=UPI002905E28A|nr:protein-glutamine gamma-glutamyltransferase Z-like [Ylistrum balloti]